MPRIFISIGSNVEREHHVDGCLRDLKSLYGAISCSSVYETRAVGFAGDDFYNLVVAFDSDKAAMDVSLSLKQIERDHGRKQGEERFGPRTLDLDLLLYGDQIIDQGRLQLPRDEIERYAFVLCPLAEMIPDVCHPINGRSYGQMWAEFTKDAGELRRIDYTPPTCL